MSPRAAVAAVVLLAVTVPAAGSAMPDAHGNGLPRYVHGYTAWPKLNRAPIRGGSAAHHGTKNVRASRRPVGGRYPVGAIVIKTATPPGQRWLSLVATMRKVRGSLNGGWRWEEFTRSSASARFTKVGFPESGCAACHAQARTSDFVFTRR